MAAKVKEKAIEEDLDEGMLFAEFDRKDHQKAMKNYGKVEYECAEDARIEDLKQENAFLKAALSKLLQSKTCERQTCSLPVFQTIYFDNRESRARKTKIESVLHDLSTTDNERQDQTSMENERAELQSSVTELNLLLKDRENCSKVNGFSNGTDELSNSDVTIISSVKYFDIFCIDCFGFPLNNFNPRVTEGWVIPVYDQVFRKALPCSDETPKIKVKFMKKCFNCDSTTHSLQDCPEPQDTSRINANRSQFTSNQQTPFLPKSRYHANLSSKNFMNFKPGFISDKLRDALDIKPNELPPYIYQMRHLGYPPGYLPHNLQPDLLLYDAEGNIDTYMGEDLNESDFKDAKQQVFVEYPGLNVPVPEGVKDHHNPPMQHHQQLANMMQIYKREKQNNNYNNSFKPSQKRKMQELERDEKDMDIDNGALDSSSFEFGTPAIEEPSSKRGKYDLDKDENEGGYSPTHPSLHFGEAEKSLMKQYRHAAHEKEYSSNLPPLPPETPPKTPQPPPLPAQTPPGTCPPPLPLETPPSLPKATPPYTSHHTTKNVGETGSYFATPILPVKRLKVRKCQKENPELEEGEIQSDEEVNIDEEEEKELEGEEELQEKCQTGWWLKEPLSPCYTKPLKGLSPPPQPRIKLPMEALSRFYTSSTVLQKLSFEDRILWLDPVFGNLQLVSGRYERLKEILRKIPKKSSKR